MCIRDRISEVIGRAAVKACKPVRGAETHGMAQRGGSVINHTRIGCTFGPMVSPGSADLLLALEPAEALRYAHFLSPQGIALVNTRPVLPVSVTSGLASYPPIEEILDVLSGICREVRRLDATAIGERAGTAQAMNVVMLGALSRYLPIPEGLLIEALAESVPCQYLETNRRAFLLGKAEVESGQEV
ncbi:MAG: indolepyruvate ferredoxin oxidoreductase subunit beta [Methanothrix sp.]|nr:indolepyruvate ferredoxin oxidoreductase subunit beta [Methanothrix sp.]